MTDQIEQLGIVVEIYASRCYCHNGQRAKGGGICGLDT